MHVDELPRSVLLPLEDAAELSHVVVGSTLVRELVMGSVGDNGDLALGEEVD